MLIQCLNETFLESSVDPFSLLVSGYVLFRGDHPEYVKRSVVLIYGFEQ